MADVQLSTLGATIKTAYEGQTTTALSVIGRSANSAGVLAPIAASAASGAVLRESGSVIDFGTIATAGLADGAVTAAKASFTATDRLLGRSTAGAGNGQEIACTAFGRSLIDDADAAAGRTTLAAAPTAAPTFTGLMTVAGVKVASGTASGTLTEAAHGGGVFTTSGNCTCPNAAGFSVTLVAGGAHTVNVGTGATTALATGDVLSVFLPAVGTARAVKTLAADVISMPVS